MGPEGRGFESLFTDHYLVYGYNRAVNSKIDGGYSSVGRALDCDSGGREFESR
ncbi:conserved hypothetical protein [Vibrio harveyi]|nr:conserved hypothetical protein [Vibrio rotiferianus]CAH1590552.1 conserved hypothetical protein [Vibrio harveyi]